MRLKIDTSEVRFRVAGPVTKRKDPKAKDDSAQAYTLDGRPIWTVRLDAIEDQEMRKETIWVEVAGDEPKVTFEEFVHVHRLVFAPWVNRDGKIMRSFKADQVTPLESSGRRAA